MKTSPIIGIGIIVFSIGIIAYQHTRICDKDVKIAVQQAEINRIKGNQEIDKIFTEIMQKDITNLQTRVSNFSNELLETSMLLGWYKEDLAKAKRANEVKKSRPDLENPSLYIGQSVRHDDPPVANPSQVDRTIEMIERAAQTEALERQARALENIEHQNRQNSILKSFK